MGGAFRPIQLMKFEICCVNSQRLKTKPMLFGHTSYFLPLCPLEMASDCHELFLRGETTSGIYTIQPVNAGPFKVFCEMTAGKMDEAD